MQPLIYIIKGVKLLILYEHWAHSHAARHMPPLLLLVMIVAIITYEMYCDFIATWERKEPQHKLKLHNNH